MPATTERIEQEIKNLPLDEQLALSQRLSERLLEQRPLPSSVSVVDGEDLEQKCVDALTSPAAPMTEGNWVELREEAEQHYRNS